MIRIPQATSGPQILMFCARTYFRSRPIYLAPRTVNPHPPHPPSSNDPPHDRSVTTPAGTSSFDGEEHRERAERAVIDDRGYIHFVPALRPPKG